MVAQIASFTQIGVEYDVTVENGKAVHCTCLDHQYRNRTCKHMTNANTQVEMEIERAATFLALKRQIEAQERSRRENAACYRRMMASAW